MPYDYSDAPPLQFDLIPQGKIATVSMHIRPGGAGEDGLLKRSADGASEALDCEFTILDNEKYGGRKVWQLLTLAGTTDGHATAGDIARRLLRAIVESARNIRPNDNSEAAQEKRKVSFSDFCGMRFIAKITVEKSKDPAYPDKNKLEAVTPDLRGWHAVEQVPVAPNVAAPQAAASTKPAQAIARPNWAKKG